MFVAGFDGAGPAHVEGCGDGFPGVVVAPGRLDEFWQARAEFRVGAQWF